MSFSQFKQAQLNILIDFKSFSGQTLDQIKSQQYQQNENQIETKTKGVYYCRNINFRKRMEKYQIIPKLGSKNMYFLQVIGRFSRDVSVGNYILIYQKFDYDCFKYFSQLVRKRTEIQERYTCLRRLIKCLHQVLIEIGTKYKVSDCPCLKLTHFKVSLVNTHPVIKFDSTPASLCLQHLHLDKVIRAILYEGIVTLFRPTVRNTNRTETRQSQIQLRKNILDNIKDNNFKELDILIGDIKQKAKESKQMSQYFEKVREQIKVNQNDYDYKNRLERLKFALVEQDVQLQKFEPEFGNLKIQKIKQYLNQKNKI